MSTTHDLARTLTVDALEEHIHEQYRTRRDQATTTPTVADTRLFT